jgi:hypothetical protein
MTFSFLSDFARITVLLFLFGLAVTIAFKILSGVIGLGGLFYGIDSNGHRKISPERIQMFLISIGVAFQYIAACAKSPGSMPQLPDGMLEVFGASHAFYLGGKAISAFRKPVA